MADQNIININGEVPKDQAGYWFDFDLGTVEDAPDGHHVWVSLRQGDKLNAASEAYSFLPDDALVRIRDAINAYLAKQGT